MALCWAGVAAGSVPAAGAVEPYRWRTGNPESEGLSAAKLAALKDDLAARHTAALLIVCNDRIVLEWYAPEVSASTPLGTASMAKGLVGGMAAALALDDGLLSLDDLAAKLVPQWRDDPLKAQITVRQLGSHTSGLEDAEAGHLPHDKLTGWKGDFWKTLPVPNDPFTIARDLTPVLFPPGKGNGYSNPGIAMLGYTITAALRNSPQKDIRTLLRDRIMRRIGIPDGEWRVGYGKTFEVDGLPLVAAWGGGNFTARGMAQIGRLMLREGDWDGQRILARASVHAITELSPLPGDTAVGWWSNRKGKMKDLPLDTFYAAGAGHKVLVVIPSLKCIVVRNGQPLGSAESYFQAEHRFLFTPLINALKPAGE